ncbi:MAG: hypothetical protein LBS06_05150 [Treponema sp.]|jgi:hypothetical protein|nr:hypothetical protein [Treponema sp.]
MAQTTDLYSILKAYANKNNSPYIDIDSFLTFLEKYSARKAAEQSEWAKWTTDTGLKFWSEMAPLAESEKCVLLSDTPEGRIYMPSYYVDLLRETWKSIDDTADRPFPGEESMRIIVPENQCRIINLEADMGQFFTPPKEDDEGEAPNNEPPIVKLIFPEGRGSALLLSSMIPRRLVEMALLKVRHYLRSRGSKEFVLHKLSPQFQGREKHLREILDQVIIRPLDFFNSIESVEDFSWLFWACFCPLVKNDFKRKKEILSEDLAAIQAVYVMEICGGFYKARAKKARERGLAFKALDMCIGKAPGYHSMEAITKFTTDKGVPLLGQYSREELDAHIKKKTAEGSGGELPEWLILQGKKGERWYIKKENFLPLCARLLISTRPLVKKAITKRWITLIKTFRGEAAMERDADFDKLLAAYTASLAPVLMALLEDQKLLWIYEETERSQGVIPPSSRIFKNRALIPMSALYMIRRREILSDARIILPFWYSVPILTAIIAFFSRLGRGEKKKNRSDENPGPEEDAENREARDIQNAAREIEASLVPRGQTLDEYLTELESRWIRIINKQARSDLLNDVNSLVRDHLRQAIRIRKNRKIGAEQLNEMAAAIISHTPALQGLSAQDSLRLYMELYIVKLLLTWRL